MAFTRWARLVTTSGALRMDPDRAEGALVLPFRPAPFTSVEHRG
jgi:hypothetical protein